MTDRLADDRLPQLSRVNNHDRVRQFHDHGYKKEGTDLLAFRKGWLGVLGIPFSKPTPEEAIEIYHQGKAERYALTSVIAARVIDRAIANRPNRGPYGLIGRKITPETWREDAQEKPQVVNWIAMPEPFRVLDMHMSTTLLDSFVEEQDYLETLLKKSPNNPVSSVY